MKIVNITIVGTCTGNAGPGRWACVLRYGDDTSELAGGFQCTTKRRMELRAVVEGLQALREPCEVNLISDDQNLLDGIGYWRGEWRLTMFTRLWKRLPDPLPDGDLWLELDTLANKHLIRGQHVDAIFSHPDKQRCDEMAQTQAKLNVDVPSGTSLNQQVRDDKRTIRQVLDEATANDYEIEFESSKRADTERADPFREISRLRALTRNSKAQHKCHV